MCVILGGEKGSEKEKIPLVLAHALQPSLGDGAQALQEVVPALLREGVLLACVALVLQLLPLHLKPYGHLVSCLRGGIKIGTEGEEVMHMQAGVGRKRGVRQKSVTGFGDAKNTTVLQCPLVGVEYCVHGHGYLWRLVLSLLLTAFTWPQP